MEIYNQWLKVAADDLLSAKKLYETGDPIKTTASFHAQQCAEKSLKAFLAFRKQPLIRTHDLENLISLCASFESNFTQLLPKALFLNSYSTTFRYPGDNEEPTNEEVENSIRFADDI